MTVRLIFDLAEWNEPRVRFNFDNIGSAEVASSSYCRTGVTAIDPEHNYHDLGAGMLIDELLGTIDKAIGEYEG